MRLELRHFSLGQRRKSDEEHKCRYIGILFRKSKQLFRRHRATRAHALEWVHLDAFRGTNEHLAGLLQAASEGGQLRVHHWITIRPGIGSHQDDLTLMAEEFGGFLSGNGAQRL